MNIEDLKIGMNIIDKEDNFKETILELTKNSMLVTRTKRTKNGINCTNWFSIDFFDRYFKI